MDSLANSIGHPWHFSVSIEHISDDLGHPDGTNEKENAFVREVQLLDESAYHQSN